MRFFDLSHTIEPGMPVYPGSPSPGITSLFSLDRHGFAERVLTLSTHTGTHIDLPSHMLEGGRSLDDFGVECFLGKGYAMDIRTCSGDVVTHDDCLRFEEEIRSCEFLLLCSGWSRFWGEPAYYAGYPVLSPEAARWLSGIGLKGIGVDMISVDTPSDDHYRIHNLLLENGIVIIENLNNLSLLLSLNFSFSCFPLRIAGAEASPARAVAIAE